jgi:hypothetical protein
LPRTPSARQALVWAQDWVQVKKKEWLRVLCKRHQTRHLDFGPPRLLPNRCRFECHADIAAKRARLRRPNEAGATFLVQLQSNSRGWLHRVVSRKRHQMRHWCDFPCFLAKHATPLQQLYHLFLTTNISNKIGEPAFRSKLSPMA